MNILLTGGAGYVGSHVLRMLKGAGHRCVVFDNLCNGHREAVGDAELVEGDILDGQALARLFEARAFDAVMHFCGLIEAGESVVAPDRFYRVNVAGGLNLLDAMRRENVRRILFSSTAAVYGDPQRLPIDETHPTEPVNPYGRSKLMFERILEDYRRAYGLGSVSLRYFNAAGADESGEIGEAHRNETHLIPLVLASALDGRALKIYGKDYNTRDGTAVRDFVHVTDLARAHVDALRVLEPASAQVFNVGSGEGYTVREVIEAARRVTGREIPAQAAGRRPGDCPVLVAGYEKIRETLGWSPRITELEDIIRSAWNWQRTHPKGFAP